MKENDFEITDDGVITKYTGTETVIAIPQEIRGVKELSKYNIDNIKK
jgi:hypothetical protein